MFPKYSSPMDTHLCLLGDFAVVVLYVHQTPNGITIASSFSPIRLQNGKYIEVSRRKALTYQIFGGQLQ